MFNWNKSSIDCFSNILLGLLSAQTINLSNIAIHFKNNNKIASNNRRIQSFLKDMKIDCDAITHYNVR
ncbi:hypothetical protein NAI42_09525, partial [Francisella tularensis subsp. holarctica]|nr:hypothetical protein [Francisella tularensis subsp. holarctica]